MTIDLHTHSTASDGTDTPASVMRQARNAGLRWVALTDHDTTGGWDEAWEAAGECGIGFVPGIEVTCRHEHRSVHLLAYLPDPDHAGLFDELDAVRDDRTRRLRVMTDRLADAGYPVSFADVLALVRPGSTLGRPHLADALVKAGVVAHRSDAFTSLLAPDSEFYEPHYSLTPVRAVQLVRAAGGVPVVAHPFACDRGEPLPVEVIADMVDAGMLGIEARHRDHDYASRRKAEELAADLGIFHTGSSDFHGLGKRDNRLGENTTSPAVLEQILEAGYGARPLHPQD